MAGPKVFISSTCFDLKPIRDNLDKFIRSLGFDPVRSDKGSVVYDPTKRADEAAVSAVGTCDMLVLIVGGRYGSVPLDKTASVTNAEYRAAIDNKIPVFALVDSEVNNAFRLWKENQSNTEVDVDRINFPGVESCNVFRFLDEVQSASVNNAVYPFGSFDEIEHYLRQQWSGMFQDLLTDRKKVAEVSDTLTLLQQVGERIEFIAQRMLSTTGNEETIGFIQLMKRLSRAESIAWLVRNNLSVTPYDVLKHESFPECITAVGGTFTIEEGEAKWTKSGMKYAKRAFERDAEEYLKVRAALQQIQRERNLTLAQIEEAFREAK